MKMMQYNNSTNLSQVIKCKTLNIKTLFCRKVKAFSQCLADINLNDASLPESADVIRSCPENCGVNGADYFSLISHLDLCDSKEGSSPCFLKVYV